MSSPVTTRRLGLSGGTAYKAPVACATTGNIVLSGEQTIDGVLTSSSRVLVKDQTDGTQNGIYLSDTGSWIRDYDFDGPDDVATGTQVFVNLGGASWGGTVWVYTGSAPVTFGTTVIAFTLYGSSTTTSTTNTASAGQTSFLVATYQPGTSGLQVFVNGLRQSISLDYTETDTTHITFVRGLEAGDQVVTFSQVPSATLTAASASASSVSDSGSYYVGTTVEAVLQEIATGIAADNGDASATLTNASSDRIQRWNTALTANRSVTLSASNAEEGARFWIVRGAGATGNFTLSVGSLATLRAPGEWCSVVYDSGTSAWMLAQYGILPSAEILQTGADVGDASSTLTVGSSARTQRWLTALTAERTATLSSTGAYTGARFRVQRASSATGAFSLSVLYSSSTLARLAPGQWSDFEYTGTAWACVARGDLAAPNSAVVTLMDDFLGEEIDNHRWQSLIGTDPACVAAIVRSEQLRGMVRLTTGANAGATMALNGAQLASRLNWQANQGGLIFEARIQMDAITNVAVFLGFTNQDSAAQIPIQSAASGNTLTYNANDAVGVMFDTSMATDDWWLVGVKGGVGAAAQDYGAAPLVSTMETWRIEIDTSSNATFYRNGSLVGATMANAVTANVPLTPVIACFSETAASRNIDVDYVLVQAQR